MTLTALLPAVAGVVAAAYLVSGAVGLTFRGSGWMVAVLAGVVFLGFSVWAVVQEGPLGFWPIHASSLWGNQVWVDLLLAASIAWTFILPRARSLGLALVPWALAVLATGSIGLLALTARVLWLEARRGA